MKTITETTIQEWQNARDKLLDTYVKNAGETYFSLDFIERFKSLTSGFRGLSSGVNLKMLNPHLLGSELLILDEIAAIHRGIEAMPHLFGCDEEAQNAFWFPDEFDPEDYEEHDPYSEDVYHEDDPRLGDGGLRPDHADYNY